MENSKTGRVGVDEKNSYLCRRRAVAMPPWLVCISSYSILYDKVFNDTFKVKKKSSHFPSRDSTGLMSTSLWCSVRFCKVIQVKWCFGALVGTEFESRRMLINYEIHKL